MACLPENGTAAPATHDGPAAPQHALMQNEAAARANHGGPMATGFASLQH